MRKKDTRKQPKHVTFATAKESKKEVEQEKNKHALKM